MMDYIKYLTKPALWERSAAPFWSDEYISKRMLDAHLACDNDAASRKADTIEHSVKWLSGVIPSGARLLDLGCGPGLYARRLSALGYSVTGIDCSKRSIEYAKARDESGEYIVGDYLNMDYAAEFDAATLIYCDYAALTRPERAQILKNVMRALKPGGLFIFDVYSLAHYKNKTESTSWEARRLPDGFWSASPYLCLEATYMYENNTVSADRYLVITDAGATDYIVWDTVYTAQTIRRELEQAGFGVSRIYGDACGSEYTDESETLCVVAFKPGLSS